MSTGTIQPYYGALLDAARAAHRVGRVGPDPLVQRHAFVSLGAMPRKRKQMAVWMAQAMRQEVRVLGYGETSADAGRSLGELLEWLRAGCCLPGRATVYLLPGIARQAEVDAEHVRAGLVAAGYEVMVSPVGVSPGVWLEAGLRLLPSVWIDEPCCSEGLLALQWYRPEADEFGNPGALPRADWSAGAGEAFGLMCEVFGRALAADPYYASLDYSAWDRLC